MSTESLPLYQLAWACCTPSFLWHTLAECTQLLKLAKSTRIVACGILAIFWSSVQQSSPWFDKVKGAHPEPATFAYEIAKYLASLVIRFEVLFDGLCGIPEGLERLHTDGQRGIKLVARRQAA
ncbi:hypothetical protein B0H15DRAFT_802599 [Mycena belliarum]|uniref:Uncharacterized protein n=1 Tax=Mycena belliarum TaxID=1033014 RepID=A0AAD6TZS6_9AGAR|nr:hypothetical protein B0H15DRAFT_802599 [Mycena belliae]